MAAIARIISKKTKYSLRLNLLAKAPAMGEKKTYITIFIVNKLDNNNAAFFPVKSNANKLKATVAKPVPNKEKF